jgi:hypothetical protein
LISAWVAWYDHVGKAITQRNACGNENELALLLWWLKIFAEGLHDIYMKIVEVRDGCY